MNKRTTLTAAFAAMAIAIVGLLVFSLFTLNKNSEIKAQAEREKMEQDSILKLEMSNNIDALIVQYGEMQRSITNDSLIAQLTQEQLKAQQLQKELEQVKSSDNAKIRALQRELETCRRVIRDYVIQIDSLNRLNQNLIEENTRVKDQYAEANRQIEGLNNEKAQLNEKVAIAAQLDAIGINLSMLDKKDKSTNKLSKCKKLQLNFSLAKNVTAQSGTKTVYVRIVSPEGALLGNAGTFSYENRSLTCTAKRSVEYGGKETPMTLYWEVSQALSAGTYQVSIFADGNEIGRASVNLK